MHKNGRHEISTANFPSVGMVMKITVTVQHLPGLENVTADYLSRHLTTERTGCWTPVYFNVSTRFGDQCRSICLSHGLPHSFIVSTAGLSRRLPTNKLIVKANNFNHGTICIDKRCVCINCIS